MRKKDSPFWGVQFFCFVSDQKQSDLALDGNSRTCDSNEAQECEYQDTLIAGSGSLVAQSDVCAVEFCIGVSNVCAPPANAFQAFARSQMECVVCTFLTTAVGSSLFLLTAAL